MRYHLRMNRWDGYAVDSYEQWFETREGAFALTQERRLLEHLVSAWPRRGHKLLEIGCGPGVFMKIFWETGFDVSGIDLSADMLGAARRRLGAQATYHLGAAEHLPFEDNEFDYCTLLTVLEFCSDPCAALREARRVAKFGVLVGTLNRYSLYKLLYHGRWPWKKTGGRLIEARWFNPFEIRRVVLDTLLPENIQGGSVLPGPPWSWRQTPPWNWMNRLVLPYGMGAYTAIRCDFTGEKPLTPLYAMGKTPA